MNSKGFSLLTVVLFLVFLGVAVLAYIQIESKDSTSENYNKDLSVSTPSTRPFSFTAAGDFSDNENTETVLTGIGNSKSDFTLALGDLGYVGNGNEIEWCDKVKKLVGENHPFQLIAGNHDDGTGDGDIKEYAKCLPNRIDGLKGEYGIEYYYDYGNLARFILISPDIINYGSDYINGGENLEWVIDKIEEARSLKLPWIIVGMHKNCITPGVKTCEIGDDLLNTLIEKKVDIILQGHEHAYYRSKQLKLNPDTCPAILINSYSELCVAASGSQFAKGDGTIIVISGAGGRALRDYDIEDPEIGYFDSINAKNAEGSYGFSLFDVSESKISSSFVPTTGSFSDLFSISAE